MSVLREVNPSRPVKTRMRRALIWKRAFIIGAIHRHFLTPYFYRSLTTCLSECMILNAECESRVHRLKALFRGRTKADIVLDLKRIEVDVSALFLRFFVR